MMDVDDIGRPRGVLDRLAPRLVAALADPAAADRRPSRSVSRSRRSSRPATRRVRSARWSIGSSPSCVPATSSSSSTTSPTTTRPCWRGAMAPRSFRPNRRRVGSASRTPAGTEPTPPRRRHCCSSTPTCARRHSSSTTSRASPWRIPTWWCRCNLGTARERWYEQASLLFNVTALMGSGAFTVLGERVHPTVAFGPVLAMRRRRYDEVGGHAAVRDRHTEDIGLARLAGGAVLFTGRPDTTFRMYPDGWRQLVDGWTRTHRDRLPFDPVVGGARGHLVDRGARRWVARRRPPAARSAARRNRLPTVRAPVLGARTTGRVDPPADRGAVSRGRRRVRADRRPQLRRRGTRPGGPVEGSPRPPRLSSVRLGSGPERTGSFGVGAGTNRTSSDRPTQTSIRILPTLAFDSIRRWASAIVVERKTANRRSVAGAPEVEQRQHLGDEALAERRPCVRAGGDRSVVPIQVIRFGRMQADVDRRVRRRPSARPARWCRRAAPPGGCGRPRRRR